MMGGLLHTPNLLPAGFTVQRDDWATDHDGKPCIRVLVRRDADRLSYVFEVPIHRKEALYKRHRFAVPVRVMVTDHERIQAELNAKGRAAFEALSRVDLELVEG